ncbi:MAG: hypothetical protein QNJ73_01120 [Gammaproteobacteria bacterium]|nr:hypothetical protein [Gammaproteobacteria bacterium]
MTTSGNNVSKDRNDSGFVGFLRESFQAGMKGVEGIHRTMAEIPLDMLEGLGVSEEKTAGVREKHRGMLRGLYGSIDSIAGQLADSATDQVERVSEAVSTSDSDAEKAR